MPNRPAASEHAMSQRIAVIGECMLELRCATPGERAAASLPATVGFGGDTLNTALYMARLGAGVDYVTALGDDRFSDWLLECWRAEGIDCSAVHREPGALPGLYLIETDDAGERRFSYWRENSPARRVFDLPERAERLFSRIRSRCRALYLTGISLAILSPPARERVLDFVAGFRSEGGRVAFDSNYRPAQWPDARAARRLFRRVYEQTDVALPSFDDEQAVFGSSSDDAVVERLRGWGVGEIVVKLGASGCRVVSASGDQRIAAVRVDDVVDTTAAGDSFNAAYLAARLRGLGERAAADAGHRLAAEVVRHRGAIIETRYTDAVLRTLNV